MTIKSPGRVVDLDEAHGGTELMAGQLQDIAESVRRLINGRLTKHAIIILIHASLPRGMKLSLAQIESVLDAAARLDRYTKNPT